MVVGNYAYILAVSQKLLGIQHGTPAVGYWWERRLLAKCSADYCPVFAFSQLIWLAGYQVSTYTTLWCVWPWPRLWRMSTTLRCILTLYCCFAADSRDQWPIQGTNGFFVPVCGRNLSIILQRASFCQLRICAFTASASLAFVVIYLGADKSQSHIWGW